MNGFPSIPDFNNVEDLLKSIRVRVGFEEPEEVPSDPFETQYSQPVNLEQVDNEIWNPIISATTNTLTKQKEDEEAATEMMNHPVFKHFENLDVELFDRMADEVLDPSTPFGEQDALALIADFIVNELKSLDKSLFQGGV